jgi:sec-independent protein translocase protein TatB
VPPRTPRVSNHRGSGNGRAGGRILSGAMLNIGPQELLLVLIVALLVVGPQRLPELSRQIGKGLREFRKVQDDVKDLVKFDLSDEPAGKPTTTARPASPMSPGVHRTPRSAPASPPAVADPAPPSSANGDGPA